MEVVAECHRSLLVGDGESYDRLQSGERVCDELVEDAGADGQRLGRAVLDECGGFRLRSEICDRLLVALHPLLVGRTCRYEHVERCQVGARPRRRCVQLRRGFRDELPVRQVRAQDRRRIPDGRERGCERVRRARQDGAARVGEDLREVAAAHGRVPEDALWAALEGRPGRVRAGDVLGPRSLEEAVLEGVLAVRAARTEVLAA
jgi:hypothetical protein